MTRRSSHPKLVVANWKMGLSVHESTQLAKKLKSSHVLPPDCELVLCPTFSSLSAVAEAKPSKVGLGSQDVFWERHGAFTGEVSVDDLIELGCRYVILGHSERRRLLGETDEMVRRKVFTVMARGLTPIICVGETAEQRRRGLAHHAVARQLQAALKNVPPPRHGQTVIVAYEPVWAISPGGPATPTDARDMAGVVHQGLVDHFGQRLTERQTRVLYGGSVSAETVADFVDGEHLHGVLVGAQSQHYVSLAALLRALSER